MTDSTIPAGLSGRGRELWDDLAATRDLTGGGRRLAEEACRIADRLDKLHRHLIGDAEEWLTLRIPREAGDDVNVFEVHVDKALGEARQQANILRQIVAGLPVKGGEDDDDDAEDFLAGL